MHFFPSGAVKNPGEVIVHESGIYVSATTSKWGRSNDGGKPANRFDTEPDSEVVIPHHTNCPLIVPCSASFL